MLITTILTKQILCLLINEGGPLWINFASYGRFILTVKTVLYPPAKALAGRHIKIQITFPKPKH